MSGPATLLVITHSYLPDASPRAIRWSAIAEEWVHDGHKVDVLCSASRGRSRQESINGVNVFRAGPLIGARRSAGHQNWLYGPSRTPVSTPRVCNALGSFARLRTTARAVGRHIWRNTYWPDYAVVWWHSAVRRASLLMNIRPYDAVVSVSLPFTGHFVAWSLCAGSFPAAAYHGLPILEIRFRFQAQRLTMRSYMVGKGGLTVRCFTMPPWSR